MGRLETQDSKDWIFLVPVFYSNPDCGFAIAYDLINSIMGLYFDQNTMQITSTVY